MIDPALPLTDLHRHLDGNVRLATILDLGRRHNIKLPADDMDGLRPFIQVTDPQPGVMAFISKFEWMTRVLVDLDACWRIAYENVEDAHSEGLDYVELRFSPVFMAENHALDPAGVVDAVIDGARSGERDFNVQLNLIGIISRTYGPEMGWRELEALLAHKDSLCGLDLAGDEANIPGDLFREHFKRGRDAGWNITVHAGESAGPRSIWQAVKELGASRIGHGVAAVQDHDLMEYLREYRIGIEANLTSNLQTTTVNDYAAHPVKEFLEHGLLVTLNTDDPGISGIDIAYEYEVAAPAAGLSREQIRQIQINGIEAAFLSEAQKEALRQKKLLSRSGYP